MNRQQLVCEIAEDKIELENHYKAIRHLKCRIDNSERKLEELNRRETIEKYKPQLEGIVDKYIDDKIVKCRFNPDLKFYSRGTLYKNFDVILQLFKSLKEKGQVIYLYKIGEPHLHGGEYFCSYITFKDKEVDND